MAITTASRDRALSDEQWERIEPLLPSNEGRKGHPFENNRMIEEGIIYRTRTGIPWRDLPRERFGLWQTVWKRHYLYARLRSEEHTSELQSRFDLVFRLLLV